MKFHLGVLKKIELNTDRQKEQMEASKNIFDAKALTIISALYNFLYMSSQKLMEKDNAEF